MIILVIFVVCVSTYAYDVVPVGVIIGGYLYVYDPDAFQVVLVVQINVVGIFMSPNVWGLVLVYVVVVLIVIFLPLFLVLCDCVLLLDWGWGIFHMLVQYMLWFLL